MPFDVFTNAQYSWVKIVANKAIVQAWKVGLRKTMKKFDALLIEKGMNDGRARNLSNQHHVSTFFP